MSKLEITQLKSFIDSYDTFLLDCDGVVWQGNTLIEHSKETIMLLKSLGKRIIYVTNNVTVPHSRHRIQEKSY
jgi:ribonucleotide monophosphatase NagD (HAD superfamily)